MEKVDGLETGSGKTDDHDDNDPEAAARHARRLQMRRERAAHAAEEDSYGWVRCGVVWCCVVLCGVVLSTPRTK